MTTTTPRRVDVGPSDLVVVRLPNRDDVRSTSEIDRLAELALSSSGPFTFVRDCGGDCAFIPRSCVNKDQAWMVDQEPRTLLKVPNKAALRMACAVLTNAGLEALVLSAPLAGHPCILIFTSALPQGTQCLSAAGFSIEHSDLLASRSALLPDVPMGGSWGGVGIICGRSSQPGSIGVWSRGESISKDVPRALRFESGHGLYVDLRLTAHCLPRDGDNPEVIPIAHELFRSAAEVSGQQGLNGCHGNSLPADAGEGWVHLHTGIKKGGVGVASPNFAVLELLCSKGMRWGIWIFVGQLFVRVVGCSFTGGIQPGDLAAVTELLHAAKCDPVGFQSCSGNDVVLGFVEAPGQLIIICRSWAPSAPGKPFYDAKNETGGIFKTQYSEGLVEHKLPHGEIQFWRVLEMRGLDPFGSVEGAVEIASSKVHSPFPEEDELPTSDEQDSSCKSTIGYEILSVITDMHSQSCLQKKLSPVADGSAVPQATKDRLSPASSNGRSSSAGKKRKHSPVSSSPQKARRRRQKDKESSDREKSKEKDREQNKDGEHHRDGDKHKDGEKGKERDRDREKEREKDRREQSRHHEKDKESDRDKDDEKDRERDKRKEREREREKEREKDRDKDSEKDRDKDHEKDKDRDRDRHRDRDKDWDKEREKEREKARDRARDRDRDRDRDRERGRDRDRDRDRDNKDRGKSRSKSARRSPRIRPARGGFDQKEPQAPMLPGSSTSPALGLALATLQQAAPAPVDPEVEAFLAANPVDQATAFRFRALPSHLQRLVLFRGSLVGTRDPSAVLMSRVRDAIQSGSTGGAPPLPPASMQNPEVEAFLAANPVDFQAANRLRALPPELQRLVLIRGSLSGVRDASSVLMSRVRDAMGVMQNPSMGMSLGMGPSAAMRLSMPAGQLPPNFRPGDWMCPKCNFHNYSSKIVCTQCATPMLLGGSMMSVAMSAMAPT